MGTGATSSRPWTAFALLAAAATSAYCAVPPGRLHDSLYNAVGVAAAATMTAVLVRRRPPRRAGWPMFLAGFWMWVAGDLHYTVVASWLGRAVPAFSASDALYLAGYVLMAAGLLILSTPDLRGSRDALLDAGIVSVGISLLVWAGFVDPLADDVSASAADRLVGSAYPVLDVLLLSLLARLLIRTRLRGGAYRLLSAGVVLNTAGDVLWRGHVFEGSYSLGSAINVFFLVGYACFALAVLHPSSGRPPAVVVRDRLTRGRIALLALSVVAVPAAVLASQRRFGPDDVIVLATGSGLLLALMLARLVGMVQRAERSADEARAAKERLETIVETSPVPLAIVGADGLVVRWNEAAARTMGWKASSVVGRPPPFVPAEDEERVRDLARRAQLGEQMRDVEVELLEAEGRPIAVVASTAPLRDEAGNPDGFVAVWTDITERKLQEERLRYLAVHDSMTGLPNRRAFEESLRQAVEATGRGRPAALLLVDLDNFKLVNDSVGHPTGDLVLVQVVEELRRALRPGDVLARFGGDELAALVHDVSGDEARQIGERMVRLVGDAGVEAGGEVFRPTVSVGLCPIGGDADDQAVIAAADAALYEAKRLGRNRLVTADAGRSAVVDLERANQWAARIRRALVTDRLTFFLQPIVRIESGERHWHEALARIVEEDGTLIQPSSFLPAAERFGLTREIDRRVLELVLEALAARSGIRVFANLSAGTFHDEATLRLVQERHEAIAPGSLGLEITETTAMLDLERSAARLELFRRLGCVLSLDDFGVGFSSFAQLQGLPVDYVKIPADFTAGVATEPAARAVVEAIASVAHALGKQVIAEGVETEEVAAELLALDVEYGQGFLWAPPSALVLDGDVKAGTA